MAGTGKINGDIVPKESDPRPRLLQWLDVAWSFYIHCKTVGQIGNLSGRAKLDLA
jgi:hypothetical protein